MKKVIKSFSVLFLATLFLAACSSDDNGDDNNLVDSEVSAGTYTGYIGYVQNANKTETQEGSVEVTHKDNVYSFDFSNDIPDLNGIPMKQENNVLINSDKTIKGVVKIVQNENKLIIHYEGTSERWDAEAIK